MGKKKRAFISWYIKTNFNYIGPVYNPELNFSIFLIDILQFSLFGTKFVWELLSCCTEYLYFCLFFTDNLTFLTFAKS